MHLEAEWVADSTDNDLLIAARTVSVSVERRPGFAYSLANHFDDHTVLISLLWSVGCSAGVHVVKVIWSLSSPVGIPP